MLYGTDYIVLTKEGKPLMFTNTNEVIIYGNKEEAKSDSEIIKGTICSCISVSDVNKQVLMEQVLVSKKSFLDWLKVYNNDAHYYLTHVTDSDIKEMIPEGYVDEDIRSDWERNLSIGSLSTLMVWSKTLQGHDYWERVERAWCAYRSNKK